MKAVKVAVVTSLVIGAAVTSAWLAAIAASLVSARSDVAVAIGWVMVAMLVGAVAGVAAVVIGKMKGWQTMRRGQKFVGTWSGRIVPIFIVLVAMAGIGCGYKRVPPGYVGIKVDLYGKDKGVEGYPLVTGAFWYNPLTTNILEYPTFVQTAIWTRSIQEGSPTNEEISYNSSEGLIFTADISLSYSLIPEKVPAFYVKFRSDDLTHFTHGILHNIARDAFNAYSPNYTAEELYGKKKEELLMQVRKTLNEAVQPYGVVVDQFGYVGAPRPPDQIVAAINSKITATQNALRVENEVRQAEAEAKKNVAMADGEAKVKIALAEGQAQANKALTASLSEPLIRWRELDITEKAVAKWNGARPMVEGKESGLLLSITPEQK